MKQFSATQLQLLDFLADGECHSGSTLGNHLQISRTAVWKQIKQLGELGITVKRLPNRGYQLISPRYFLRDKIIHARLATHGFTNPVDIHLFAEIDSTNQFLKDCPASPSLTVCCAEMQSRGRGRFGRQWISPFAENIYFSGRWELHCCLSRLSGLSLAVSLAVLACLNNNGIKEDIRVKWPNDLLWRHKKLAGVLIEVQAESNGQIQLIIGIGINTNTATQLQQIPDKPWCSLYEITGRHFDRNLIIADLIVYLDIYLNRFLTCGFPVFQEQWQQVDYLRDQWITVTHLSGSLQGLACGVSDSGQLYLRDEQGMIHELSSGDTSVSKYA
ncbi:biotin--[acetyl-CoA-carboxylase] ligase [Legionella spiritensis]|uniref:biotin--[acetyl-CoA-carboxylase] ligase n=1 Tax=Legionella spiritensis TaxID=452 RepID=UPI000F711A3E|nr:biotin--[acetyl-CoA-carboxylase] ligase [Legionella spiritensis]VEG90368.1 biotin-[acetylCoA carboxylase] holoenzyme synthetase and biotin operon repressor [Legionella spiritensis]